MDNKFIMVAKTFAGLEETLRDELIALGAENIETGIRMVKFEGDKEMLYRANLSLRTALRILKPITEFEAEDTDALYDYVRDFDWEQFIGPDSTFAIDSTVNSNDFTHSRYVTYRVKDGIADHFSDKYGRRPSIRVSGADMILNVHISGHQVTISLDSSGEPLNRRGYRVEQTEAPINEVLAAGIILQTGWHGEKDFADPMCGSGTFLIEAALIAGNINPGIYRENFAFEKWPDFDKDLFETLYNDDSEERDINCAIMGGDIDPEAVSIARKNIKAARLEQYISLTCRPMQDWQENGRDGVLVTNPPYGERLRPADMSQLYKDLGHTLKQHFQGWQAWVLGYRDEHFADIGLKPSVKIPLLNGALECSLREYVLFDGKYNEYRAEGGAIKEQKEFKEAKEKKPKFSDRQERKHNDRKGEKRYDDRKERRFDDRKERRFDDRKERRFDDRKERRFDDRKERRFDDRRETRKISDKGPKMGVERTTFSSEVYMRRRKKRDDFESAED